MSKMGETFQEIWHARCLAFDEKMRNCEHLSDQEQAKLLDEFNHEMNTLAELHGFKQSATIR